MISFYRYVGFFLLVLCAGELYADDDFDYVVYGVGGDSCVEVLDKIDDIGSYSYQIWIEGYVSAFSTISANSLKREVDFRVPDVMDWLIGYCENNHNSLVANAAEKLMIKIFNEQRLIWD